MSVQDRFRIGAGSPLTRSEVRKRVRIPIYGADGAPEIFVDASGNVGIGTTEPADLLHIKSSTLAGIIGQSVTGTPDEQNFQLFMTAGGVLRLRGLTDALGGGVTGIALDLGSGYFAIDTASANEVLTVAGEGILSQLEGSVPGTTTNYGKVWWQSDNTRRGLDGDGKSHIIHGDAFNSLLYGSATAASATVTIANQNEWTLVDVFNDTGDGDDEGNVTASTGNSELTLGAAAAGAFNVGWGLSFDVAGGSQKTLLIAIGIERPSKTVISAVSNANPAVVTSAGNHELQEGDSVIITGVGTPASADGSFFVNRTGAGTFALYDLSKAAVDTSGEGAYVSGGTIDLEMPKGMIRSRAANSGNPGIGGADDISRGLAGGADLRLYVANTEGTQNIGIWHGSLFAQRAGD